MKTLPYFRWYPADAETDLAYSSMDWQERGLFHHCLNVAWINGGIPATFADLARALKTSPKRLEKPWATVSKQFHVSETNELLMVNDRQEEERIYASTKSERNTNAVRTRYERRSNEPQRAYECDSLSEVEPSIKKETSTRARTTAADLNGQTSSKFEDWWALWVAARGNPYRDEAARAWCSVVSISVEKAAMDCSRTYLAGPGSDPGKGYRPDNFLFIHAKNQFEARYVASRRPASEPIGTDPTKLDGYKLLK